MRYINLHLRYITLHYIEDSCGFQWRDVDAVTLEFPLAWHGMAWHGIVGLMSHSVISETKFSLDLHNTSPEYSHRSGHSLTLNISKMATDTAMWLLWKANRKMYPSFQMLPLSVSRSR